MKLLILSIILLGLGFAGIAIKILTKKNGEFDGTCAGSNVRLKAEGITCGCGKEGSCNTNLDNLEENQPKESIS